MRVTSSRHESGVLSGASTDTVMERAATLRPLQPTFIRSRSHWARICSRLQAEVGEVEYHTWLRQMTLGPVDHDEITLYLPTRFLRDWVRSQYGDRLGAMWNGEFAAIRRVELMLSPELRAPVVSAEALPMPFPAVGADCGGRGAGGRTRCGAPSHAPAEPRGDLAAPLDPRFNV